MDPLRLCHARCWQSRMKVKLAAHRSWTRTHSVDRKLLPNVSTSPRMSAASTSTCSSVLHVASLAITCSGAQCGRCRCQLSGGIAVKMVSDFQIQKIRMAAAPPVISKWNEL